MPEISADLESFAPRTRTGAPFWRLAESDFDLSPDERSVLQRAFHDSTALDQWLPNGETYRRRAYGSYTLSVRDMTFTPIDEPPPYMQSTEVNPLVGGIERRFRHIEPSHAATEPTRKIAAVVARSLAAAGVLSAELTPEVLVDAHYMAITAPGEPAPEGKHRDGLIAGSAHLIERRNLKKDTGISSIYDGAHPDIELAAFELQRPLDSYVFDDARVQHFTSRILPTMPDVRAYRNVLLLGFRRRD
ncbi:2OG-Fe dioxygenase family protein [Nocardia sp. NBC_00565]|uniref:2OG-Fe dioxygenase family protein n=1 Tax=Nocardia sp. NBC_00565 TaxID=2975993 RepID=UPI002E8039CC|nr:2OG-Fe dioxygenase family protein [Nocardia sp. NBC_00565]WUC01309.1 2OG-Fe dioxygenase family protein [Nocardia sp. NBC_00565]